MAILNGNVLTIITPMGVLPNSTVVSMDISNGLREVTTVDTDSWKEVIDGVRSVSMSFEGLLDKDLITAILLDEAISGVPVELSFGIGVRRRRGNGFITSFNIVGGTDDNISYSGSVDITGELTEDVITAQEVLLDNTGDPITDAYGEPIIVNIRV